LQSLLPAGATIAPIIIATDKTQLTQFSGGKSAYPVYLTIGNLPKAIRRQPSRHSCILLAYLPVNKISRSNLTQQEHRSRSQRLFHQCMRMVLSPLIEAGKHGVNMSAGNGSIYHVHPIISCYVADYPEQCLVACSKSGTCPKCRTPADHLQDMEPGERRTQTWIDEVINNAKATSSTQSEFFNKCMSQEVSGSLNTPFWRGFPFTDIPRSIMPDVLHQLYQGILKHLIAWCRLAMPPEELDRRIRTLPAAHGLRHFKNGISALSQISGSERKNMAKILLGCLVGALPKKGLLAVKSILDFIYLAQYATHDKITLGYMEDALEMWEKNRSFFIQTGIRENFNIPKFHSLLHYVESIKLFGTTDNYNTEMFERLHIDLAKHGWRASNFRDEFPQMISWLSRQEKIVSFDAYVLHTEKGQQDYPTPFRLSEKVPVKLAKYPNQAGKTIAAIEMTHQAPGFSQCLKEYLNQFLIRRTSNHAAHTHPLPFSKLDVFHQFKFSPHALQDDGEESDVVKAMPTSSKQPSASGRFDPVVVLYTDDAEATGMAGMFLICLNLALFISYRNSHWESKSGFQVSCFWRLCPWSRSSSISMAKGTPCVY
jgi:hypothetical protein